MAAKNTCPICENKLGFGKAKLADKEVICRSCLNLANFSLSELIDKPLKNWTLHEVKVRINQYNQNLELMKDFKATKKIGNKLYGQVLELDDQQKKWLVSGGNLINKSSLIYNYSDIVDFELLEDGESIASGGLGRAFVGGALFGGTGAVVGGITGKKKTKQVVTELKVKITLNSINNSVVYINFLNQKTKKNSLIYKEASKHVQECLSALQIICNQENGEKIEEQSTSNTDEILKYKQLLDAGAITEEEYEAKKKQLLDL